MKKYYTTVFFSLGVLLGCTKLVRIDAANYLNNQALYEGKALLISADLEEIVDQYQRFQGKDIEVTAPITHFEEKNAPVWFLTLEKNGKKIRCYEDDYRRFVPPDVFYLARWAKHEGGEVTARGKLQKWGIELDQLTYKGLIVNTNAPPS
jgi:hypothetical protein